MIRLRTKILLIVLGIVVFYGGMNYAIQRTVIIPSFEELEREGARKDLERCLAAIEREVEAVDTLCHDWAAWSDTHTFALDRNVDYVKSNLMDETYAYARQLASGPPIAMQLAKQLVRRGRTQTFPEALESAQAAMTVVHTSEDAREGPRAFAEKRQAVFKGR